MTEEALRDALHQIIDDHTVKSYDAAHGFVDLLDEDPNSASNVLLIYSAMSVAKNTWPDYNREHLWPQSMGADELPAMSDMHHIFAVDANVNSSRGNKYFDDCVTDCRSHAESPDALYDTDSWEPPDNVKGDIARALFYMDVRYDGDNGEPDLELTNTSPVSGCDCMGRLDRLLSWHDSDTVDNRERTRNELIYSNVQGNRNPFVDHPDWVAAIWSTPVDVGPVVNDQGGKTVTVYVTRTGSKYHRGACQHLRKSKISMSMADAVSGGYGPCSRCKP